MNARQAAVTGLLLLSLFVVADGQQRRITANSVGPIKIGLTVEQARRAAGAWKFVRTSDGEGVALIAVKRGRNTIMTLFAGEEDVAKRPDPKARIEQIWVWDRTFKTHAGVHPGMLVRDVEKAYGKLTSVEMSPIESREYGEFAAQPAGLVFRLAGNGDTAGVYPPRSSRASTYRPDSTVFSIEVSSHGRVSSDGKIRFSSTFTDVRTGCKSTEASPGGHVSHFCAGVGNFRVHYFDAATIYQIDLITSDRKWEVPLMMFGLSRLPEFSGTEWRLANGKPFAVIARKPGAESVIVRGLQGFETIKGEETGPEAIYQARMFADQAYGDSNIPVTRLRINDRSPVVTIKAKLSRVEDKVKYVIKVPTGRRMSVRTKAEKWSGDEGPILVASINRPDGTGSGEPGGLFEEPTQAGDYEIVITQNGAKSRATNVEMSVTVTLSPIK